MGLFNKKKSSQTEIIQLNNLLTHSFKNVQRDTANIMQWLKYFYQKNLHQEQQIRNLQEEIKLVPTSKHEIRKVVDEYYSYEPLLNRIKELDNRVEELRGSHNELHQKHYEMGPRLAALNTRLEAHEHAISPEMPTRDIDELNTRLEKLETKKANLKEKIIKRITKNSKDYIKSIVLSYIKKYGKITALQLKEMVVEEQGLCSKSSFYRLLEELEQDPEIGVIKRGKEKHYIAKIQKKNY